MAAVVSAVLAVLVLASGGSSLIALGMLVARPSQTALHVRGQRCAGLLTLLDATAWRAR